MTYSQEIRYELIKAKLCAEHYAESVKWGTVNNPEVFGNETLGERFQRELRGHWLQASEAFEAMVGYDLERKEVAANLAYWEAKSKPADTEPEICLRPMLIDDYFDGKQLIHG